QGIVSEASDISCQEKEGSLSFFSSEDSSSSESKEAVSTRASNYRAEFDQWYSAYPHKVAKPTALRAFVKVRKAGISLDVLIAGRDRYKQTKPPEIAWCNPGTWLNGHRWEDEPAHTAARPPPRASSTNGAAIILSKMQSGNHVYARENAGSDDY